MQYLDIPSDFAGGICDFGCGAGDAFPVYRKAFPKATLYGVDFSVEAIKLCIDRYGDIANFCCGAIDVVPRVDVIVCSNVLEHLDEDCTLVEQLVNRCRTLYVIVPFNERPLSNEHIRIYNEHSFAYLNPVAKTIFLSRGWSYIGLGMVWNIYLKNIARLLLGRKLRYQRKQIMFEFDQE